MEKTAELKRIKTTNGDEIIIHVAKTGIVFRYVDMWSNKVRQEFKIAFDKTNDLVEAIRVGKNLASTFLDE